MQVKSQDAPASQLCAQLPPTQVWLQWLPVWQTMPHPPSGHDAMQFLPGVQIVWRPCPAAAADGVAPLAGAIGWPDSEPELVAQAASPSARTRAKTRARGTGAIDRVAMPRACPSSPKMREGARRLGSARPRGRR